MKIADFETKIRLEFAPIPVISESAKVVEIIKRTIRYFNENYSTEMMATFPLVSGQSFITLPDYVGTVLKVYDVKADPLLSAQQPEMLHYFYLRYAPASERRLSFTEMVALYMFYQNTAELFWEIQTWRWIKPDLFVQGYGNSFVTLLFKYAYDANDLNFDYTHPYAQSWIFRYALAEVKIAEGSIIRKSVSVDITSDGGEMIEDGKQEKEKLELELKGRNKLFVVVTNG